MSELGLTDRAHRSATPSYLGRIGMALRPDVDSETAGNVRPLCPGKEGFGYKGSNFHRIVPTFVFQGGNFTDHNGTEGKSVYGDSANCGCKQAGTSRSARLMCTCSTHLPSCSGVAWHALFCNSYMPSCQFWEFCEAAH